MSILLAEIMAEHGFPQLGENERRESLQKALDTPGHSFLVAEVSGAIAGMCALVVTFSTWRNRKVCELQDVVVKERYRRRGIGGRLIGEAERAARAAGCSTLFWLAESWNLPAHAFYRSLGTGEKTVLYFERPLAQHESEGGQPPGPERGTD
ncbi:MAG: hypothetical protein Kow00129_16000 [Thermoleophilia bacterium]